MDQKKTIATLAALLALLAHTATHADMPYFMGLSPKLTRNAGSIQGA